MDERAAGRKSTGRAGGGDLPPRLVRDSNAKTREGSAKTNTMRPRPSPRTMSKCHGSARVGDRSSTQRQPLPTAVAARYAVPAHGQRSGDMCLVSGLLWGVLHLAASQPTPSPRLKLAMRDCDVSWHTIRPPWSPTGPLRPSPCTPVHRTAAPVSRALASRDPSRARCDHGEYAVPCIPFSRPQRANQ